MEFAPDAFMWHFTTTAIFILCLISGIISYHSKEKSFGYYTAYSFFLLIYLLFRTPYEIPIRDAMYDSKWSTLNWYVQVIYNCIYFLFFMQFLDVKKYYFKVYRFIKRVVVMSFSLSTALFAGTLLTDTGDIFSQFFKYGFTPIMFGFGLYIAVWAFTVPGWLKYFIVTGSLIFSTLAVIALALSISKRSGEIVDPIVYFYVGIFVEQIAFGFGLAYKVRLINQEFVFQVKENEKIKNDQNQLLQEELQKKEVELLQVTKKAEEERISKLKSEFDNEIHQLHLSSLQSQMNPHFIFNALSSIKAFLIENDKENAIFYLNKFAKLIRKILDGSRHRKVSLKEELEIIKLYMAIENMRFDNEIGFSVDINENIDLERIAVPPLILQPFLENALWHGLMLSEKEKHVEIHIYKNQNVPVLSLKDNGIGRQRSKDLKKRKFLKRDSLGLKMTAERIDHFNHKEKLSYAFEIIDLVDQEGDSCGTEVRFSFFH